VNTLELRLLNEFQRDFPLCAQPFRAIAARLGATETEVLATFSHLQARDAITRVGATIAPGRLGAATLAALAVPLFRVDEIARLVSAYAEVNHNYERDHRYNLWFVVAAPTRARVQEILTEIEHRAGCGRPLDLPMRTAFHVDLGFDLTEAAARRARRPERDIREPYALSVGEARVLTALQDGLALVSRPYAELGTRARVCEDDAIGTLTHLLEKRVVRRIGVIVNHRELGYRANAMAVWNVPDRCVAQAGVRLAREAGVTLCYVRERDLPRWPYNLYCMVHGTQRGTVTRLADELAAASGLAECPGALLFSTRRFKQCAARYVDERCPTT
jgi:DNA-binding Lrp family transcriptional regulator